MGQRPGLCPHPSSLGSSLCCWVPRSAVVALASIHSSLFVSSLRHWVPTSTVGLDPSLLGSTSPCHWSRTSIVGFHPSLLVSSIRRQVPPFVVGLLPLPFGSTFHRQASCHSLQWVVVAWAPSLVTFSLLGHILVIIRWHHCRGYIIIGW